MRNIFGSLRVRDTLLALESAATTAGCAMACPFGSSAEFEAEIIRRKIETGVYGYKRRWRYVFATAAASVLIAALFCAI
jgi:hypothetical protein